MKLVDSNDLPFRVAVGALALLLVVGLSRARFCSEITVPALPDRPAPVVAPTPGETRRAVERSPAVYAESLLSDARAYAIAPPPTPTEMGRAFDHRAADPRLVLDPADKGKRDGAALGLRFWASIERIEGTPHRQMVLTIRNTTEKHLAYRVATRPTRGLRACLQKRDLAHNAIALAPGEAVRRSECLWNPGWTLAVDRVEVVELPVLGYRYASLVPPDRVGLESRTGRGHRAPGGEAICRIFHSGEVENQLAQGAMSWADAIDFYARHRCKTYSIPTGYKPPGVGVTLSLPVVAEGG